MTAPSRLPALLQRQRSAFMAQPRPKAAQRRDRLRRLEAMLRQAQKPLAEAISADFGNRALPETILSEIATLLAMSAHARKHLPRWMRPVRRAVALTAQPARNRVEYTPLGVVGIIAPWNYPVYLTLGPLIDILAAGNRCLIKPSELTPGTSALLAETFAAAFPPEEIAVVQGGADVARAFSALPFDHLVFTGSTSVGRQVMQAASENLVPVTLELGGKSPVIIADDYDLAKAAQSVAVGKFFNAGQTCVAPDYALVPAAHVMAFAQRVIAEAEAMFPTLAGNPDCTTIISDHHISRLSGMVNQAEAAGAHVLRHAGAQDGNARVFPPTVVLNPPLHTRIMQEEIFGPVLPVIGTASLDNALAFVNARPRPLALYVYSGDRATQRRVLDGTISGGVTINGTTLHVGQPDLPLGGVGPSGMGAYHGREGFLRFSHARAIHVPGRFSGFEALRPPYGRAVRTLMRLATGFK